MGVYNPGRSYVNGMWSGVSAFASAARSHLYDQTLFFAFDNPAISEKHRSYRDLSWTQQVTIGAVHGVEAFLVGVLFIKTLNLAAKSLPDGLPAAMAHERPLIVRVVGSVMEEMILRGIAQTSIMGHLQLLIEQQAPKGMRDHYVFQWLTSPSARIVLINTIYAALHITNRGITLSDKATAIQVIRVMMQPVFGNLRETTDNLLAPAAAHVCHEILVELV